ncbi:MAG TPA: glycosyltransferase family 4 protein [Polyangia bacterium]|nr:glycosyltransferase family 4 protein [Polyangia bacterium]
MGPLFVSPRVSPRHKILYLTPNLKQGGAERQLLELIRRLPDRFEPVMCVFDRSVHYADYLLPGEPRHALDVGRMTREGFRRLCDVLRSEQPQILHTWRDTANFWGRLATARVPVPIVVSSTRNRALHPLNLLTERRFAQRTARVLANSEGVRRELVSIARVPDDKVQIIHNFIDLDRFRPPTAEERAAARAKWNIAPGDIALLVPGRISLQKHQFGVGLALGKLRRRGQLPANVRVLLAGRRHDRIYGALLDPWLKLQGVHDRFTHLGTVTDMVSLYQAADVAVLPSLWEGLPNAVLEALACGLPAVVSHAANIDGIVTADAGFEVPTFAHDALAEALGRILVLSDDERRRMGARGRAHIADNFSATRVLGEMVALYDHLLAATSPTG